jgi:hypothetical protein
MRTPSNKTIRKIRRYLTTAPLQTKEQRGKMRGRAFMYARGLLLDSEAMGVGRAPFSHIDAESVAQRAWADGYVSALRDVRKGKVTP